MEKELQRALEAIACLAMNENPDETNEAWNDVYMLAHSYSPTCPHTEWRGVADKIFTKLGIERA